MPEIADRDVRMLAHASQALQKTYDQGEEAWQESPFAWIRRRPSRQKGAICEQLVSGFLVSKGFKVARAPDSEADRLVDGVRVEIKSSLLWASGAYKFQQLRDQDYAFVLCLGIGPFDVRC